MTRPSTTPLTATDLERYARHLALPDFSIQAQQNLKNSSIFVVGAGGLGAASLPYLAGAGIGRITICDDDTIALSNLHRQTIYKTSQTGQSKAQITAAYLQQLNPDILVGTLTDRLNEENSQNIDSYTLLLDGCDNFKTKSLLNAISIRSKTPLIAASVNQYAGQIGVFAGYASDKPCYHCLFPELPSHPRNCNEAGVINTAAGITALLQAHWAITFLAGLDDAPEPGQFAQIDTKTLHIARLQFPKDSACAHCGHTASNHQKYRASMDSVAPSDKITTKKERTQMIALLSMDELRGKDHVIVDVRTRGEIQSDPVEGALHIELSEIPHRYTELPRDRLLAFVCAGNVRSRQAAEYVQAMGFDNIIVLDKFSL